MTFIPRYSVIEDQFAIYDATDAGTGAIEANSGVVVSYTGYNSNAGVTKVKATASGTVPRAFLMQSVKHSYPNLPAGFRYRGDLGASTAFLGEPVAIAHSGGVFDTSSYADDNGTGITAGDKLYAKVGGNLTNKSAFSVTGSADAVAVARNTLSTDAIAAGKLLRVQILL